MYHAKACHGDDLDSKFEAHLRANGHCFKSNGSIGKVDSEDLRSFFINNEKDVAAFEWMRWICSRNLPISEIENELTIGMVKHKPMCAKTLRKLMLSAANQTVKPISDELKCAGRITLIMDGWTCDGTATRYIAVCAGYIHPDTGKYEEVLLAIQPTLDESDMGAEAHIALFESTLALHGLTVEEHVVCIVCDNCSANKAISTKWKIPMVGCASHRFNLAVRLWIREYPGSEEALDATLMGKASNVKAASALRELTADVHGRMLAAKKQNVTRWTSTLKMVKRYLKIHQELDLVPGLEEFQLRINEATSNPC